MYSTRNNLLEQHTSQRPLAPYVVTKVSAVADIRERVSAPLCTQLSTIRVYSYNIGISEL